MKQIHEQKIIKQIYVNFFSMHSMYFLCICLLSSYSLVYFFIFFTKLKMVDGFTWNLNFVYRIKSKCFELCLPSTLGGFVSQKLLK